MSRGATRTCTAVSAFFPCYNDEPSIPTMVDDVRTALQQRVDDFEIIVVDDGSTDGSAAVLEALAGEVPELRIVRHETNRGYGGALLSGFAAATKAVGLLHRRRRPVRPGRARPLLDAVHGRHRRRAGLQDRAAATRGTARSSAACTTTWCGSCSGCTSATPTATSG